MKKILAIMMTSILLLTVVLSFASCSSSKPTNSIDFGKKYIFSGVEDDENIFDEDRYFVFNSDNTGYYKYYYESKSLSYTVSGSVDFTWREASDGAVYLFRTETHYNEDHTKGETIPLPTFPIYFSDEFFAYVVTSSSGNTVRYVKEGSELEKIMKD